MERLCVWVETFHALFVIKARLNPRYSFKQEKSNGRHNLSRLAPVELSGWPELIFAFNGCIRLLRVSKFEAQPFGIGSSWLDFLRSYTRFPPISKIWEVFGLRVSEVAFHLRFWNTSALVRMPRGVIQVSALGPLLSVISLKLSRYAPGSKVRWFNIVCFGKRVFQSSTWAALLFLIYSIMWVPNSEHRTQTLLLEHPEYRLRLEWQVWFRL